ncbi:hypothetical protein C8J56DRAFT_957499 [Mycena floridula]|nr:hypothetical protein C8J56DRAFT_957499 [Mycena floridula]
MTTTEAIIHNASYHSTLLSSISALDYVPAALKQQRDHIANLAADLAAASKKLETLTKKTKKERKEHEDLRDSVARKFAYRITGKKDRFEAKATKEEREYVDALELEMRERANQKMLEQMVDEGKAVEAELKEKKQKFEDLKVELDNLYNKIFNGPTAEFPRDDQLETELGTAQGVFQHILGLMNVDSQGVDLLSRADRTMVRCLASMSTALDYSSWDMWGGGTMADMMERSALAEAGSFASQADLLAQQAHRTCPSIARIPTIEVPHMSMLGDVFFDNIISDYTTHKKIEAAAAALRERHRQVKTELQAAAQRTRALGHDLNEAGAVLEQCRLDLNTFRRDIFLRFSNGSGGSEGPPAYDLPTPIFSPPPGPPPDFQDRAMGEYHPPAGPPPSSSTALPDAPQTMPAEPESIQMPTPSTQWGSRNPYAVALAEGEKLS